MAAVRAAGTRLRREPEARDTRWFTVDIRRGVAERQSERRAGGATRTLGYQTGAEVEVALWGARRAWWRGGGVAGWPELTGAARARLSDRPSAARHGRQAPCRGAGSPVIPRDRIGA